MKHTNVGLFVPHEGCPHMCSFCNQRSISGSTKKLTPDGVDNAVATACESNSSSREIAFFGGSFTAIERAYMTNLLKAASKHIDGKNFSGIRISTRPDCINEEICQILKEYGVTAVELGAQSMDDNVLMLNDRGHSAQDVVNAANLLKSKGFELGLQMMTGLLGSDDNESIRTAQEIIALSPDTVRIYPTVVLKGTKLARLYEQGLYKPQSVERAVKICSTLLEMFFDTDIRVIRLGLHSGGDILNNYVAGAFHPSLRELCDGEIYLKRALSVMKENNIVQGKVELFVMPTAVSQMTGQKKKNLDALRSKGYECKVIPHCGLSKYEVSASPVQG
ncbi:MAG TPA: radical SAM protein [Clostridia bacterium]|nr:radical SAM protein [Clostridia bacterium]